jgi:hypothetical protein
MVELTTCYLNFEQLDAEIVNLADDLVAFRVDTAYVTFGFACEHEKSVQWQEIPAPVRSLVKFVADSEADETFRLGESDLDIRGGAVEFLACHGIGEAHVPETIAAAAVGPFGSGRPGAW